MIPFLKKNKDGKKPPKSTVPRTAQESIPFQRMFEDGTCRVRPGYYTRTIQYQDINYQLAQQEDKTAIFEEWCSFLNFFDSSIHFELSFVNTATDSADFEKSIRIPYQQDGFDDVRAEYSQMLRQQLSKGNNGLTKTKFLTYGIEGDSMAQVKPRLEHIQNDLMNNFHRLGVLAKPLDGTERLRLMHGMLNMDGANKFHFNWKDLVPSGLSVKDAIAPTALAFKNSRTFQMGGIFGAVSFLNITASDLSDQLLKDFLDMDSSQIVTMHIQSVDQNKAIKTIKHTITELDRSKIEEQKKAVRAGYDMDVLPSDLATYGRDAKALLKELQSQNERMFLVTFLVLNTGKTEQEIVDLINDQVDNTAVRAKYQGQSATFTLKDLGIEVDGEAIASDVINAQRGDAWWQQYAFWITHDVAPQINPELADGSVVDKALNIDAQEPVDAQVALNDNNSGFNVIAGENGQGANATSIAKQAISTVESLGSVQPQTVRVELDVTEPTITNAIADEAKTTLETLVNNAVAIKVADKDIATVNASMLGSAMRIDANQQSKLKDNEVRNGYVVFDADKLQQYYDEQIKPNLKLEREDKKVVVNNAGEVLSTETEGHDGIVIADGADTEVGARLAQVLATGTGSVNVDGKVDPKQEVKVTHRVAIDLSDRKLYAYENDTVVKTLNVVVAEGNDNVTGECVGMMCTPTGDFNVWQKLPSQDMSGTLNLADGTVETWDVKDVGFVNYFSSGCAIHRIAGGYVADAVMPSIANGSHGCVGIGWDVAEWFYNWCNMGTSVHIQV